MMSMHSAAPNAASEGEAISIRGASEHNLQCVDLDIPKRRLTLLRGPSGSGKTSLAFDVLHAEGARRLSLLYGEISDRVPPRVLSIGGLPPVVAVRTDTPGSPRTSVLSFLGLASPFFEIIKGEGVYGCSHCDGTVVFHSPEEIVRALTHSSSPHSLLFSIPILNIPEFLEQAMNLGLSRILSGDQILDLEPPVLPGGELILDFVDPSELTSQRVYELLRVAQGVASTQLYARQESSENLQHRRCSLRPHLSWNLTPACERCGAPGAMISKRALTGIENTSAPVVHLGKHLLHDFLNEELSRIPALCSSLKESPHRSTLLSCIERACRIGLSHLSLGRLFSTLSTGERRRLRLSKALVSKSRGLLFLLDEPTAGLHPTDCPALYSELRTLVEHDNSVVVVEHDPRAVLYADCLVTLGPGGGRNGGRVIDGAISNSTPTRVRKPATKPKGALTLSNVEFRNLHGISLSVPLGQIVAVTGISGSGKTSLVFGVVAPLAELLTSSTKQPHSPLGSVQMDGEGFFKKVVPLAYGSSTITSRSSVATFIGLADSLRKLFASLRLSKERGYSAKSFSLNDAAGGRCRQCEGVGYFQGATCGRCGGLFFEPAMLDVTFHGVSLGAILAMTADEARVVLRAIPSCEVALAAMTECNLGYLTLAQETATLSRGELQRARLVRDLSRREREVLYLFDEPTSGLDEREVLNLLSLFERVIGQGNSIVAVEHNISFIRNADYVIDMGPGAGAHGGTVVAAGTPDEIMNHPRSMTGSALTSAAEA